MVTISIRNKNLYLISAVVILLIGISVVFAYNPNWRTTPGNASIMGHTPDETGDFEEYARKLIREETGVIFSDDCDPVLYDSMNDATTPGVRFINANCKYNSGVKDIPAFCTSNDPSSIPGCIIKQEIYQGSVPILKDTRYYNFIQDSDATKTNWWSKFSFGYDGNRVNSQVIPVYGPEGARIGMLDDYYSSTTGCNINTVKGKWVFFDRSTTYGMKVYICRVKDE